MKNKYPIYIVSKGRPDRCITTRPLDVMGVSYKIIVEEDEYKDYAKNFSSDQLIVLDKKYKDDYQVFDGLGDTKSKGPGAARNFAWDCAKKTGAKRHWVMDDNIDAFHRLNNNIKSECDTAAIFRAAEDFVDRFENVPLAGFNYHSFVKACDKVPPFIANTRIYSCQLIDNNCKYRWRGRYNEDTDQSLRILKDGLCTIQFNAFLQGKITTQRMRGGNTKEFYEKEGTKAKSEYLRNLHPDVTKVVWRFNRWHHHVDYRRFKNNKLILKKDITPTNKINNYGMKICHGSRPY